MKEILWNKLKSQRGESMIEALVACLIISLSITMVSQVIVTAADVVQKARIVQENNAALMDRFWSDNGTTRDSSASVDFGNFKFDSQPIVCTDVAANGQTATVYEFKTESSDG